MHKTYHRIITEEGLGIDLGASALETVVAANLAQDSLLQGQIGHPEFHFDENAFTESLTFMKRQRMLIAQALDAGQPIPARKALGRLTHAGQDFYAHSNYISLWLSRFPQDTWPNPGEVDLFIGTQPLDPALHSGKIYWPLEPFSFIPFLKKYIVPFLPQDSHAWMNLDGPEQGRLFPYALAAAIQYTHREYQNCIGGLPHALKSLFDGRNISSHAV